MDVLNPDYAWTNRDPIARLTISSSGHLSPSNPNGFLFDIYDSVLQYGMEKYVAQAIDVMHGMGCQGFCVWDVTGGATYQYIGSPDLVTTIDPKWGAIVGDFFARFRAARFKPGVLISGGEYNIATGKFENSPNPYATLLRKASFARKAWGCRIFYIDAPYFHVDGTGGLLPAAYLGRLHHALPGCLFIPEAAAIEHYLWGMRYLDLNNGAVDVDLDILENIPDAHVALSIGAGDIAANFDRIVASVKRRNILMADGWWENDRTKAVAEIMKAAA